MSEQKSNITPLPMAHIQLKPGAILIGRASENDLPIKDTRVSAYHAKIVTFFNASYIEDLGSTNGTFVNGKRVEKHTVHPGDVIKLGHHQFLIDPADSEMPPQESEVS